jgi:hypothetical protein
MPQGQQRGVQQRDIGAAERGLIIQRILIDGWAPAEAAQSSGITERRVKRWLADFRRQGMASLRDDLTAETPPRRWVAWARAYMTRLAGAIRRSIVPSAAAPCIVLRHSSTRRRRL